LIIAGGDSACRLKGADAPERKVYSVGLELLFQIETALDKGWISGKKFTDIAL
jgi:hypothetical protein